MPLKMFKAPASPFNLRRWAFVPALVVTSMSAGGCATMIMWGDADSQLDLQTVTVRTNPAGAAVFVDGESVGETPTTITVNRRRAHRVRLELAGHPPREIRLRNSVNPELLLNILLLGSAPFGVVIDFATGAWDDHLEPAKIRYAFDPDHVAAPTARVGQRTTGAPPGPSP